MNLSIGNIGVWGFRHYEFLNQNRPSTVGVMRLNGTLEDYLKEVNQEATEMLEVLVRQYAKLEGVTEELKRADQLGWVCAAPFVSRSRDVPLLGTGISRAAQDQNGGGAQSLDRPR